MAEQIYYEAKPTWKVVFNWLLGRWFLTVVICLILFFPMLYIPDFNTLRDYIFNNTGLLLVVALILLLCISAYLFFLYQTYTYKITDKGISCSGGIIVREDKFVPFSKITDIKTSQNIIERVLGISTISIQTAGQTITQNGYSIPEIMLEGLEDAEKPKQLLYQFIGKK